MIHGQQQLPNNSTPIDLKTPAATAASTATTAATHPNSIMELVEKPGSETVNQLFHHVLLFYCNFEAITLSNNDVRRYLGR